MLSGDRRLVDRCLKGDKAAFDRLYDLHAGRVYNLLFRLSSSRTAAEDLSQETFLGAYQALGSWRGEGRFSTWLCGIAFRQYANWRRRTGFEEEDGLSDETGDSLPGADPLAHCTRQESIARIERAIALLPDSIREVFVLVRVEGSAYREAAKCLGIPLGTVQSRLWRAVRLIQTSLSEVDEEVRSTESGELRTEGERHSVECAEGVRVEPVRGK